VALLGKNTQLGEDVSEVLEYVPASFRVIRHVRPRFACPCGNCIAQAAAPSRPIACSFAGAGLLAHIMVAKCGDHLPLYRQQSICQKATMHSRKLNCYKAVSTLQ